MEKRSPEEIQSYYFPQAKVTNRAGIVINDETGIFKGIDIVDDKPCVCKKDKDGNCTSSDPNYYCSQDEKGNCIALPVVKLDDVVVESFIVGRKVLEVNENFTIWFFTSSDGAKLLRAKKKFKEAISDYPNVLAVFMETDDSFNLFGSIMDFVVGANVKKMYKDVRWQKLTAFLERNELHVSSKDANKLIEKALSKESIIDYLEGIVNQILETATNVVLPFYRETFALMADGIAGWRFAEQDWNDEHPEYTDKKAPFVFNLDEKYAYLLIENVRYKFSKTIVEKVRVLRDLVDKYKDKMPKNMQTKIDVLFKNIEYQIGYFFEAFKENVSQIVALIKKGKRIINAFVCGLIDGFIDAISGIFNIPVFILDVIEKATDYQANKGLYHRIILEYLENGIEAMVSFNYLAFFKEMILLPVDLLVKFINFIQNTSSPHFNLTKIAYFVGYIVFGIVSIVLEILFTEGVATLERIFGKAKQAIKRILQKAAGLAEDVFAALSSFLAKIKKGAKDFATYIKQIINDFIEWLKSLFKSGKTDEVFEFGLLKGGNPFKSFAENAGIKIEEIISAGKIFGQSETYTCAATSLRMILDDIGIIRAEDELARVLRTDTGGASILDIPEALYQKRLDDSVNLSVEKSIRFTELLEKLKIGDKAIVSVMTKEFPGHAMIIDKIENGKVFLRDPLPINQGSSYSTSINDFKEIFNKRAVIIKKQ